MFFKRKMTKHAALLLILCDAVLSPLGLPYFDLVKKAIELYNL